MAHSETNRTTKFIAVVRDALRHYHDDEVLAGLRWLTSLQLVTPAGNSASPAGRAIAIRTALNIGLDQLALTDHQGVELLRRHYIHKETIASVSHTFNYADRTIFLRLHQTTQALGYLLLELEEKVNSQTARDEHVRGILASLPSPTFTRLFGVEHLLAQLQAFLIDRDRYWLMALEGMGGTGKTALARAAVETLVHNAHCQRVVWITAQQRAFGWGHLRPPSLPVLTYPTFLDELARGLGMAARLDLSVPEQEQRLRQALATTPTVLVVDNLETAADIEALTEGLHRLARPTKVILTTRHRVSAYDQITPLLLAALPPADALTLLRYHGEERQISALRQAPQSDLARIVTATGGNPLAIKLVAGQLLSLPLTQVLNDLVQTRAQAQELYTFLFRYSWERLSEPAQYLLLHIPLLDSRGATWEDLAAVSGVTLNGHFRIALQELINTSLLNAGLAGGDMVYSIHPLTEHFILSNLVQTNWHDSPWEAGNDVY